MTEMSRPTAAIMEQGKFSPTEVGITHQFTNAYVRCTDNGDVEIVAGEGLAIILHPQNRSITFVADKIKFFTKDHGGMVWNQKNFNERATKFTEPAFCDYEPEEGKGLFRAFDDFLEEPDLTSEIYGGMTPRPFSDEEQVTTNNSLKE